MDVFNNKKYFVCIFFVCIFFWNHGAQLNMLLFLCIDAFHEQYIIIILCGHENILLEPCLCHLCFYLAGYDNTWNFYNNIKNVPSMAKHVDQLERDTFLTWPCLLSFYGYDDHMQSQNSSRFQKCEFPFHHIFFCARCDYGIYVFQAMITPC